MNIKATVFIPTFNGAQYLDEVLKSIFQQKTNFKYEVLIIDSGSTDTTLKIINKYQKKHKNLRLHQILNSEFGHGKTRNLAAQMAEGEYVVYLTHDATPATKYWLYEMLKPFEVSNKLVAVMGKQTPRKHCIPLLKYEIHAVFKNLGPDFGTTLFYKDDFIRKQEVYDAVRFYSDANSATRRDFLLNILPYRDIKYAEDQAFGQDIIEGGYIKAYAPRGRVLHSNDLKLSEYKKRMFDEIFGLRKSGAKVEPISVLFICRLSLKKMIGDSIRILKDKDYSSARKLYWLIFNPLFIIEKWRGVRRAALASLDDATTIKQLSLESQNKNNTKK